VVWVRRFAGFGAPGQRPPVVVIPIEECGGRERHRQRYEQQRPPRLWTAAIAALLPRLTRPAFRRRTPATAQVLADWAEIIGPAIAAVTTPRRLASGTLTIACAGPIAMELQHLANEVMGRINAHLGCQLVTALRFVQTAVHAPPYGAPAARPDPEQLAMVEATLSNLPEGDLRTALAALGRAIATPKQHRR
jgi:hypothetical protein